MTVELTEQQRRLVASFRKGLGWIAPEALAEHVEAFAEDLIACERTALVRELKRLRDGDETELAGRLAVLIETRGRGCL
jgi:hypothetical protein